LFDESREKRFTESVDKNSSCMPRISRSHGSSQAIGYWKDIDWKSHPLPVAKMAKSVMDGDSSVS
jgi:hypothetical protein